LCPARKSQHFADFSILNPLRIKITISISRVVRTESLERRSKIGKVISVSFSWAQTSSVSGTVKDTSGAVIARATVVVSSPERGITREMSTNSTGEYNQFALPAGHPVTADHPVGVIALTKNVRLLPFSELGLAISPLSGPVFRPENGRLRPVQLIEKIHDAAPQSDPISREIQRSWWSISP
jgi:hypothetical protein